MATTKKSNKNTKKNAPNLKAVEAPETTPQDTQQAEDKKAKAKAERGAKQQAKIAAAMTKAVTLSTKTMMTMQENDPLIRLTELRALTRERVEAEYELKNCIWHKNLLLGVMTILDQTEKQIDMAWNNTIKEISANLKK